MGIPTIRVIEAETRAISRFEDGRLDPIRSRIEQLPGSRCTIDWDQVENLLDF